MSLLPRARGSVLARTYSSSSRCTMCRDRLDRANQLQPLTAGPQIAPALIGVAAAVS